MAELMLGQPLFPGDSGIEQLVEIIKTLGTPTRLQIRTMNPDYMEHQFPQIKPFSFDKVDDFHLYPTLLPGPEASSSCTDKLEDFCQVPTRGKCWS